MAMLTTTMRSARGAVWRGVCGGGTPRAAVWGTGRGIAGTASADAAGAADTGGGGKGGGRAGAGTQGEGYLEFLDFDYRAPRLLELVLVRHGESEGNIAYRRSRKGDSSLYHGEFLKRHSSKWRLTERGKDQAIEAGQWLQEHCPDQFDRTITSEYLRAMETAARLGLEYARWEPEVFLRERDWGQLDLMGHQERVEKMSHELQRRDLDPFLYAPPGGESLAEVALRVDRVLSQLHREWADRRAVMVTHGELMWALRFRIEHMSLTRFRDLTSSSRLSDHIHNGHILHYTRVDPQTGEVWPHFEWMRSVCPWDQSRSTNRWQRIQRTVHDSQSLLATAEQVPRIIMPDVEKSEDIIATDPTQAHMSSPAVRGGASATKGTPMTIHKALVVDKMTRYETERERYGADDDTLRRVLMRRGIVYDRLRRSAEAHALARDNIVHALESRGISTAVVKAPDLRRVHIEGVDAVFSAGGDGTLLTTASMILDNTPVIGVNTDPAKSQGSLCCCRLDMTGGRHTGFDRILNKLEQGEYRWHPHTRLQITKVSVDGVEKEAPMLVLNEILISVLDPAKPSILDVGIDHEEREVMRCSGLIVSTGTGSTAWYSSVTKTHSETVRDVLHAAGMNADQDMVERVTKSLHQKEVFPINDPSMAYVVREPIVNHAYGQCHHRIGRAQSVSIRSLGWDGQISIDGIHNIACNFGEQVYVRSAPPECSLLSVRFDGHIGDSMITDDEGRPALPVDNVPFQGYDQAEHLPENLRDDETDRA